MELVWALVIFCCSTNEQKTNDKRSLLPMETSGERERAASLRRRRKKNNNNNTERDMSRSETLASEEK